MVKSISPNGAVVAHAFNPSTWDTEAGRFLSSRPAWSTE
jgi:major histocompatibility complex class I